MYIVFDMYGVIIKESKGNFIPYVRNHFPNTNRESFINKFTDAGLGKITSKQFIESLGFSNSITVSKDYIENHLTFDSGFISFAEKYKNRFKYALLSNDVGDWSEYITKYHDIDKYFICKAISSMVGFRKPDKEIYEILLDDIYCSPDECIFIDNSVRNLITAERLGMKTVLFNRDNEEYGGDTVYSFDELDRLVERKYL